MSTFQQQNEGRNPEAHPFFCAPGTEARFTAMIRFRQISNSVMIGVVSSGSEDRTNRKRGSHRGRQMTKSLSSSDIGRAIFLPSHEDRKLTLIYKHLLVRERGGGCQIDIVDHKF